jgi:hypothetical protein
VRRADEIDVDIRVGRDLGGGQADACANALISDVWPAASCERGTTGRPVPRCTVVTAQAIVAVTQS